MLFRSETSKSRIGLEVEVSVVSPTTDIGKAFADFGGADVIIVDEAQFLQSFQIDQLRSIVDDRQVPVLCFGLRTDFQTHLFPGSRRLFEISDSISEIKTICDCGSKATVNARMYEGKVVTEGEQVFIGVTESYVAMCYSCWKKVIKKQELDRKSVV